jgi:hypothetical protein
VRKNERDEDIYHIPGIIRTTNEERKNISLQYLEDKVAFNTVIKPHLQLLSSC